MQYNIDYYFSGIFTFHVLMPKISHCKNHADWRTESNKIISFHNYLRSTTRLTIHVYHNNIVKTVIDDFARGQTGPNAVSLINGQVMLDCPVSSMEYTQWTRTTNGFDNTLVIAFGCSVIGNNAAYYSTEHVRNNSCILIIGNATMQMGGVYTCFDGSSTTYRSLVTVVGELKMPDTWLWMIWATAYFYMYLTVAMRDKKTTYYTFGGKLTPNVYFPE